MKAEPRRLTFEPIAPTEVSFLWRLVPARFLVVFFHWRFRRHAQRAHVDVQREFRAQFPLLTPRNRREVANLLRHEWDHTGTRLLGVPLASFDSYADGLLMALPHAA